MPQHERKRDDFIYIIGVRVIGYFLPFRCRVGVNWQSEKRVSLERAVMHRRATEARRTRRYALPMGIQVEEEEYGGAETGSTWKAKRHGTRGRRKIEGTRLNVGQRRKLRRKACPVAMDSIRPEDVESPSSNL